MKIFKKFIFTNMILWYIIHLVRNKTEYGGIAQLGEHLLCKQGVIGSIPIISTKWEKGHGPRRNHVVPRSNAAEC